MKKITLFLILLILLLNNKIMVADITFIDSLDNTKVVIRNNSLYVLNNDISFLSDDQHSKFLFYKSKEGEFVELFNDKLETLNPEKSFSFLDILDTNLMVFPYGNMNYGNGVVVKDKSNWAKYDYTNSELNDVAPIYDVFFSSDGEIALINTTDKISFIKDGKYSFKDCNEDFECMPRPFSNEIGLYFENCMFYLNSKRNFTRMCNREIDRIFSYQEFEIQSKIEVNAKSFSIHKERLYFCNKFTNRIYSIKGDDIQVHQPITEVKLKEFEFEQGKSLLLFDYIFGNDGYLYCLYKEAIPGDPPTPAGNARLIKMTDNFEIVEVLPLPNEQDGLFNAVFKLVKDTKDTNNKKLYISASIGFYIYDPDPTSVKNNSETGLASLYITEVYPNPSGGLINVQYAADLSNSGKVKMFVTNVMGQNIKEFVNLGSYNISTGYGTSILDVSDIASGSYQLVITDGNRYVAKNILIIR